MNIARSTVVGSVALALALAATGCALPSASTDDGDSATESELRLSKSSAKKLFDSIDAQQATFPKVASALGGKWSPAPGRGSDEWIEFGGVNTAGEMSFSYQMTIPNIALLEKGYGLQVAKSMFSAAHFAELKALTPSALAAAGGNLTTEGFPQLVVTGRAHIEAPLPFSGYRVVFVADTSVPKAFQSELDMSSVGFVTAFTFDHASTPCLKSHVDLGGVVCDKSGPDVTVHGTGSVDLWLTLSGGRPNPTQTSAGTSHVFQRRIIQP